ncbi:hypothetical protein B566_EDAN007719 [Ephemera danica]|nr:hypothetical protein B566_EDAN007719 [Ephemera danica]
MSASMDEPEINVDSDSRSSDEMDSTAEESSPTVTSSPVGHNSQHGTDFDKRNKDTQSLGQLIQENYGHQIFGPRSNVMVPSLLAGTLPPGLAAHYSPAGTVIRVPAHRPPSTSAGGTLQGGSIPALASPFPWLASMDPLQRSAAFASHVVKERLTVVWTITLKLRALICSDMGDIRQSWLWHGACLNCSSFVVELWKKK